MIIEILKLFIRCDLIKVKLGYTDGITGKVMIKSNLYRVQSHLVVNYLLCGKGISNICGKVYYILILNQDYAEEDE